MARKRGRRNRPGGRAKRKQAERIAFRGLIQHAANGERIPIVVDGVQVATVIRLGSSLGIETGDKPLTFTSETA